MKTIDIHTHGIGSYDTRTSAEEDIHKIAEILGSHGVSEIIPTVYSAPIKVMRENMMTIKKAMEKQKNISNPPFPPLLKGGEGGLFTKGGRGGINHLSPITHHPSRIIGVHLEGPFLNPSRCGSLNAMTFIEPGEHHFKELIEGFEDIVKIITIAPEIEGATSLIKKISEMGIIVSMGHSDATFSEAEAGFDSGAKGITHIFNAMRSFHHRDPGIAGFGVTHKDIYIEVIADPFHLHPQTLELIFRTKNPERIIIISDSVKETPAPSPPPLLGESPEATFKGGGWGRVQGITDSQGKLLGGSMTIVESSMRLIQMGFDEDVIMGCITTNPERYLSM